MHIKSFTIQNFKSFQDLTLHLNEDVNILTGENNTGKTTVLEAVSLWHECFTKLIRPAEKGGKTYRKGDWVLGNTQIKYFPFEAINSVQSPQFEDIFYNLNKRLKIGLRAILSNELGEEIEVPFVITESGSNYKIELADFTRYSFSSFNRFFRHLPDAVGLFYATPVAVIGQSEDFATDPQIRDAIRQRKSSSVLRNRLYKMLRHPDPLLFDQFSSDLSFVLFNNIKNIELHSASDVRLNPQVKFIAKMGSSDVSKDISLYGSGTLQIIEILLNLYQPGEQPTDFNLILLDEPDSHIHRDIQKRLLDVLTRFSQKNQIILSSHNESLIRSAAYSQVFHLDGKPTGFVKSIDKKAVARLGAHFKGIFPSQLNPVIRSVGNINGLDFANAMEADTLIFVEGEDDARSFYQLLQQQTPPPRKKYMFWVLGGISKVFENIVAYKTVFSEIKNDKTLWEKSILIFDKDRLTEVHRDALIDKLREKLSLRTFSFNAYTFESTLVTDLGKLANILTKWLIVKGVETVDSTNLYSVLQQAYSDFRGHLEAMKSDEHWKNQHFEYKNVQDKSREIFGKSIVNENEPLLVLLLQKYHQACLDSGDYYKLMKKEDVELVINQSIAPYSLIFSIEIDMPDLLAQVDKSNWISEWDFLLKI